MKNKKIKKFIKKNMCDIYTILNDGDKYSVYENDIGLTFNKKVEKYYIDLLDKIVENEDTLFDYNNVDNPINVYVDQSKISLLIKINDGTNNKLNVRIDIFNGKCMEIQYNDKIRLDSDPSYYYSTRKNLFKKYKKAFHKLEKKIEFNRSYTKIEKFKTYHKLNRMSNLNALLDHEK